MTISERIFKILKEKSITQKEFSEKTGIPQSTISDWKHKHINPSAEKIMIICDVLDISPSELLTGTSNEKWNVDYVIVSKGSDEYLLLEQIRNLPQGTMERIQGYLKALQEMA